MFMQNGYLVLGVLLCLRKLNSHSNIIISFLLWCVTNFISWQIPLSKTVFGLFHICVSTSSPQIMTIMKPMPIIVLSPNGHKMSQSCDQLNWSTTHTHSCDHGILKMGVNVAMLLRPWIVVTIQNMTIRNSDLGCKSLFGYHCNIKVSLSN